MRRGIIILWAVCFSASSHAQLPTCRYAHTCDRQCPRDNIYNNPSCPGGERLKLGYSLCNEEDRTKTDTSKNDAYLCRANCRAGCTFKGTNQAGYRGSLSWDDSCDEDGRSVVKVYECFNNCSGSSAASCGITPGFNGSCPPGTSPNNCGQ